jgi:hypothetical protein
MSYLSILIRAIVDNKTSYMTLAISNQTGFRPKIQSRWILGSGIQRVRGETAKREYEI